MVEIAVNGANGRMGRSIIRVLPEFSDVQFVHAYDRYDSPQLGADTALLNVQLEASAAMHKDFDVLIDFSVREAAIAALHDCCDNGQSVVIGVTGFSQQEREQIEAAANVIAIVFSPNMSMGINLCFRLIGQSAALLKDIADIDITDVHHRSKADAPSGTALEMGNIIADRLGLNFSEAAVYDARYMPVPRPSNKLLFQTARSGDVVGDHTVAFTLNGERVEITHRAFSRLAFARGAVRAARWVHDKPPGLYGMEDVLGL